jgi:hypothetical protein
VLEKLGFFAKKFRRKSLEKNAAQFGGQLAILAHTYIRRFAATTKLQSAA